MIKTSTSLQRAYNKLYIEFRNYVWDFSNIEALADLEIEVYMAFPDLNKVKTKFKNLKRKISQTDAYKDEDLKESFEMFEEELEDIDNLYVNLKSFKEVVVNEYDD